MRLLLDTHAFLWWIADDERLSREARALIANRKNEIIFSAVSGWEIAIKAGLGRLELPESPAKYLPGQIAKNSFQVLAVELRHALSVSELPNHHNDPFDRLLIAQAQSEDIAVLTRDENFAPYGVAVAW